MTKAGEKIEILTIFGQVIILSFGFGLIFSWDAEIQPKGLALIILFLLVLIYPMTDRLNYKVYDHIRELHKAHSFTQIMVVDLRELISKKIEDESLPEDERLEMTQNLAEKYDKLWREFEEGFEDAFQSSIKMTGADRIGFWSDIFSVSFYFLGLIVFSALFGWFISVFF